MREREIGRPLVIAAAVVVVSTAAFLIVEFGSGSRQAPDREVTKAAAQSIGAKVIPTQPKLAVEPTPPGPKPLEPGSQVLGN